MMLLEKYFASSANKDSPKNFKFTYINSEQKLNRPHNIDKHRNSKIHQQMKFYNFIYISN